MGFIQMTHSMRAMLSYESLEIRRYFLLYQNAPKDLNFLLFSLSLMKIIYMTIFCVLANLPNRKLPAENKNCYILQSKKSSLMPSAIRSSI